MSTMILNYTPHTVNLPDRQIASNGIARVAVTSRAVSRFDGIDIFASSYGEVEGLPAEQVDICIIVSRMVAAASDRGDLLVPSGLVRDDKGRVIGCAGLEVA